MTKHKHISRRYFLGNLIKGGCASLSMIPALSSITNLQLLNATANANKTLASISSGRKTLVCLLLNGGNDSFNMLVPTDTERYQNYKTARGNTEANGGLALEESSLLSLNNYDFGLHSSLPKIANLFNNGKVSFITNVGPTEKHYTNIDLANSNDFPLGLYSHSDQRQHWQTSLPQDRNAEGWFGKMTELIYDSDNYDHRYMNISLAGNNIIQTGGAVVQYPLDPSTDTGLVGIRASNSVNGGYLRNQAHHEERLKFIDSLYALNHNNLLEKALKNTIKDAKGLADYYSTIANISDTDLAKIDNAFSSSIYTDNSKPTLGKQLKMVAKTLCNDLTVSHQTFFVELDGFDQHDELLLNHSLSMTYLDNAIGDFYTALEDLGIANDVVLFTVSDFARKLIPNGDGSDHGWGGHQLVIGGDINGGQIFGDYPNLATGNPDSLDRGGGRFIPTTSCDEYFADLALWFADNGTGANGYASLSYQNLKDILPNIEEFISSSNNQIANTDRLGLFA